MNDEIKIAIVIGLLFLLGGGAAAVVTYTQRGLRNNNPGNIRKGQTWGGEIQGDDPDFETFATPEYGIRAMAKVLKNYQTVYGINTIRGIISRWAPASENDTDSYISSVAGKLGVSPDAPINVAGALPVLIPAIIQHENGLNPYSANQILAGIRLA